MYIGLSIANHYFFKQTAGYLCWAATDWALYCERLSGSHYSMNSKQDGITVDALVFYKSSYHMDDTCSFWSSKANQIPEKMVFFSFLFICAILCNQATQTNTVWTKVLGHLHVMPTAAAQPWISQCTVFVLMLMLWSYWASASAQPALLLYEVRHFMATLLWILNVSIFQSCHLQLIVEYCWNFTNWFVATVTSY